MYWMRSKPSGRLRFHLPQKIEQIIDVGTFLVEIERIAPIRQAAILGGGLDHPIDTDHALDIPVEIVAVELDFQVRQPVGSNPFAERFGQAVVDPPGDVLFFERIERPDQVIQRHLRFRRLADVAIERFPGEIGAEVMAEIVIHEIGAVGVIAIQAVDLAEGVMQGGVERTGADERAEDGNLRCYAAGGLDVFVLQRAGEIDRMAGFGATDGLAGRRVRRRLSWRRAFDRRSASSDGNDQTLPSGIEPKPRPILPASVWTVMLTFSNVTRSRTMPPNLIGVR